MRKITRRCANDHTSLCKFDELGAEFASALDHFDSSDREKQEALAVIVASEDEVVHQSP